jgi:hypothetical protein
MSLTAKDILDRAVIQLQDLKAIRWTRQELLRWASDAQRQIVLQAPSATATTEAVKLAAGTRQLLPDVGWLLLDVYRNVKPGVKPAPGRVVRLISRSMIDRFNPNWHAERARPEVINYLYDVQDPTTYWVYPPNDGTGMLEINYSATPDDLVAEDQELDVQDVYGNAVLDYIMFRACSKDAEYAPGLQLAQGYLATFTASVGGKAASEDQNAPVLSTEDDKRGTST